MQAWPTNAQTASVNNIRSHSKGNTSIDPNDMTIETDNYNTANRFNRNLMSSTTKASLPIVSRPPIADYSKKFLTPLPRQMSATDKKNKKQDG